MRGLHAVYWLVLQLAAIAVCSRPIESYSESLLVRRVSLEDLAFRFEFVHRKQDTSGGAPQYETFPKLVDQMVSSNVSEVRLVLTRGKWLWSSSETMWPSVESGSPGAEIWAETRQPEMDWPILIRSLAGLTCASLDILDFNSIGKINNSNVVFAHLPSETVCVENLAPFLKLLPCRHEAGLGSLISAKSIVREARYYSMAITVRRKYGMGIELIQSLSVVLPIKSNLHEIFPKVSDVQQCGNKQMTVVVDSTDHRIFPPAEVTDAVSVWKLDHRGLAGLHTLQVYAATMNVKVIKWQTGTGSLHGRMSTELICNTPLPRTIKHMEYLPHFMQPRMNTLQVTVGSSRHTFSKTELRNVLQFTSGDGKGSPGHFTFSLPCPANDRILITYEFDKMFLFYAQYPPNPNRGFDVPSSITLFNRTTSTSAETSNLPAIWKRTHTGPVRVASEALLVYLAHPDFSMPYNVITLSSMGFAMFLGMIFNISVRGRGDIWMKEKKSFWKRWVRQ